MEETLKIRLSKVEYDEIINGENGVTREITPTNISSYCNENGNAKAFKKMEMSFLDKKISKEIKSVNIINILDDDNEPLKNINGEERIFFDVEF